MVVPSKNFTIISDSAIDADSPITADLMEDFRDNDIFLEEWLGDGYTAAKDHDHDGVNSAPITLAAYNAQHTVDPTGASWSISTGALGFTPNAMILNWIVPGTSPTRSYVGWGMAVGAGAGDQVGVSLEIIVALISFGASDIMGYGNAYQDFSVEQAAVTVWGSGAVTIATQSAAWAVGTTLWANIQIWGS